jgi:hypothetical protein
MACHTMMLLSSGVALMPCGGSLVIFLKSRMRRSARGGAGQRAGGIIKEGRWEFGRESGGGQLRRARARARGAVHARLALVDMALQRREAGCEWALEGRPFFNLRRVPLELLNF